MKKIIIASKNPVKINAVKMGFERMFPSEQFEVEGVLVSSDVSDQPMTDKETKIGAINRVNNAKEKFIEADFWVGIEGGVENVDNEMEIFAWIVIKSKDFMSKSKTGVFFLPPKVAELVNAGKEVGEADDIVFGDSNSKQKNGAVGLLTGDVIVRTSYYVEAMIFALIPFKNPKLYIVENK